MLNIPFKEDRFFCCRNMLIRELAAAWVAVLLCHLQLTESQVSVRLLSRRGLSIASPTLFFHLWTPPRGRSFHGALTLWPDIIDSHCDFPSRLFTNPPRIAGVLDTSELILHELPQRRIRKVSVETFAGIPIKILRHEKLRRTSGRVWNFNMQDVKGSIYKRDVRALQIPGFTARNIPNTRVNKVTNWSIT